MICCVKFKSNAVKFCRCGIAKAQEKLYNRFGKPKRMHTNRERVSTLNVNEALKYIHSICWMGMRPGLGRTRELLEKMGNPEKKLKFIHIAGTNGKGSTAAML